MKYKIIIVFVSVFAACILGEIGLRNLSVLKTYTERNGEPFRTYDDLKLPSWYMTMMPCANITRKTPEFEYSFNTNTEGLRGDEIKPKDDSVFRIIALGDSYTEGVGADDVQKTWPKYLEQDLCKSLNRKVEVINAGVSGSDPFQEFILLKDKMMRYQPDLIVMAINNSDIDDYTFRGGMERFQSNGTTQYRKSPWIHPFYKNSFLFRLFTHTVLGYDKTFIKYSEYDEANLEACSKIAEVLKQADSLCKINDSKFLAVIHSRGGEMKRKMKHKLFTKVFNPYDRNISYVKDFSGFKLIDIQGAFNACINEYNFKEMVWSVDAHYTYKGYQKMAELIADSIMMSRIISNTSKKI